MEFCVFQTFCLRQFNIEEYRTKTSVVMLLSESFFVEKRRLLCYDNDILGGVLLRGKFRFLRLRGK